MNNISDLKGLATGIGSLPHKDAEGALDLIFKYTPGVPFWPQLPKQDIREGMVAQFSEGLPAIKVTPAGVSFEPEDKEKDLEKFYEKIINEDLEYFKISPDFSKGLYAFYRRLKKSDLGKIKFIKCQITGPFTFGASINDEKGRALLHDPVFMQAIIKGLTLKAIWQIRFFKEFAKDIILFLDEPYLSSFGSAYSPINRGEVIKGLVEITAEIKNSQDIFVGVHCCGNTDWSIFTEIKTIDIISFDAFSFLDKLLIYAQDLERFLKQKRALCWGIVPTQEFSGDETVNLLIEKINAGIKALTKKGIDRKLLLENFMLSPTCGLGTLDIDKSESIFKLLSEVSKEFSKNTP